MIESGYQRVTLETIPVTVSQTLSKHFMVTKDVNNEDINNAFHVEHWELKSLLSVLREYIALDLNKHVTGRTTRQLKAILSDCNNWIEDEFEIIKQ